MLQICNSIIPIRETEITKIKDDEDTFTFSDIEGVERSIKISSRKYYKNLDTYIRERPIGIFKIFKKKRALRVSIRNYPIRLKILY